MILLLTIPGMLFSLFGAFSVWRKNYEHGFLGFALSTVCWATAFLLK